MAVIQLSNDPLGTNALIARGNAQQQKQAGALEQLAASGVLKQAAAKALAAANLHKSQGEIAGRRAIERLKLGFDESTPENEVQATLKSIRGFPEAKSIKEIFQGAKEGTDAELATDVRPGETITPNQVLNRPKIFVSSPKIRAADAAKVTEGGKRSHINRRGNRLEKVEETFRRTAPSGQFADPRLQPRGGVKEQSSKVQLSTSQIQLIKEDLTRRGKSNDIINIIRLTNGDLLIELHDGSTEQYKQNQQKQ